MIKARHTSKRIRVGTRNHFPLSLEKGRCSQNGLPYQQQLQAVKNWAIVVAKRLINRGSHGNHAVKVQPGTRPENFRIGDCYQWANFMLVSKTTQFA